MLSEQMKISLSTPESYLDYKQKQIIEEWCLQVMQLEEAVQAALDYFEDGATNKEQYRAYERFVDAVQSYLAGA